MAKSKVPIADLAQMINSEIPALAATSSRIKQELKLGDEALKKVKELNPELNSEQFLQDYRKDVESRAIDPMTGKLVAPHLMTDSKFQKDILNPDFLSRYIGSAKGLINEINNPKGKENVISVGSPEQYVEHKGVVPDWAKTNFTQEDLQKGGGFMNKKGFTPQLSVKGTVLPMDKLPSDVTKNKPFNILNEDAYNNFVSSNPQFAAQVPALSRQAFPTYDDMNETSKKYVRQHVLYNLMDESLKTNPFHVSDSKTPNKSVTNINSEKKKNDTNDFVSRVFTQMKKGSDTIEEKQKVMDLFGELYSGGGSKGFEKAVWDNDGKLRLTLYPKVDGVFFKGKQEKEEVVLDPTDKQFGNILAGYYKQITGSDAKLDNKIFSGNAVFNKNNKQKEGGTFTPSSNTKPTTTKGNIR